VSDSQHATGPIAPPDSGASLLDHVDVVLHRPQSSDNVGAVARAMKNFGLRHLVLVSPKRWEPARAKTLAVQSEEILDDARLCLTLEEALAPHLLVIPTTERAVECRPPPLDPRGTARALLARAPAGRVALLFGEEATGVSNALLSKFAHYSSIPSDPARRSLNLAQAVLLYSWELFQEAGAAPRLERPDAPGRREVPAEFRLLEAVRARSKALLLANGFLNPQQPDQSLDELMRAIQRAEPTAREIEMLLAALAQLQRTSTVR